MIGDQQPGVRVRVVYALAEDVWEKALKVPRGTTAMEAVVISQILDDIPDLLKATLKLGVFGELIDEHYMLLEGDRVEIYRPLAADPKDVRRRLAREGKVMGRAGAKGVRTATTD